MQQGNIKKRTTKFSILIIVYVLLLFAFTPLYAQIDDAANEQKYEMALQAIENDDYLLASSLLTELGGYKDCLTQLYNYRTERINTARQYSSEKKYTEAYAILTPMEGVYEADYLLAEVQKADKYDQALIAVEYDDYPKASELFNEIGNYSDSYTLFYNYKNDRVNRAKQFASEQNYSEAYAILAPMEGVYEADYALAQIQNEDKYGQALSAIDRDDYQKASELLTEISSYKDSYSLLYNYRNERINKAKDLAAGNHYQEAYAILTPMEGVYEADYALDQIQNEDKYNQALTAIDNADYTTAIQMLTELGYYKDSLTQLNSIQTTCRTVATERIKQNDYDFALNNADILDNSNFMMFLNNLLPEEASNFLRLMGQEKLTSVFSRQDIYNKIQLLNFMGKEVGTVFLSKLAPAETITLFNSLSITDSAAYLSSMEPVSAIAVLDSMDKYTAVYYISAMENEAAGKLFENMTAEKTAEIFNLMSIDTVSLAIKNWKESDRINVFKLMDHDRVRNIYAKLDLPKCISLSQTAYTLAEDGKGKLTAKLTDSSINWDEVTVNQTNDYVASLTDPGVEGPGVFTANVSANYPGMMQITFESIYGRVLSDTITVSVLTNTPVPSQGGYLGSVGTTDNTNGISGYSGTSG